MIIEVDKVYNIRDKEDWGHILKTAFLYIVDSEIYIEHVNKHDFYGNDFCIRILKNYGNNELSWTFSSVNFYKDYGYDIVIYERYTEYSVELI